MCYHLGCGNTGGHSGFRRRFCYLEIRCYLVRLPWRTKPDFQPHTTRVLDVVDMGGLGWLPAEIVSNRGIQAGMLGLLPLESYATDQVSTNMNGKHAVLFHQETVVARHSKPVLAMHRRRDD